jgi:hypothetical protein
MAADSPQNHLDEDALVNLNQQLFDDPAAGIRLQKRERRSPIESRIRFAQPGQGALTASVDRFRQQKNPNLAKCWGYPRPVAKSADNLRSVAYPIRSASSGYKREAFACEMLRKSVSLNAG